MGPFRMGDLAGLDIGWAARKRRAAEFPDRDFSNVADELCEAGRFGQKTGAGWYRYEAGSRNAIPDPAVTAIIEKYRQAKGHHAAQGEQSGNRRALHLCADQRRRAHRRGWHRAAQFGHRHRVPQRLWLSGLARRPDVLCRPGGLERGGARAEAHRRAARRRHRRSGRRRRCSTRLAQEGKTFSAYKGSDK